MYNMDIRDEKVGYCEDCDKTHGVYHTCTAKTHSLVGRLK